MPSSILNIQLTIQYFPPKSILFMSLLVYLMHLYVHDLSNKETN